MSSSSSAIVYTPETERTLAFGSISGTYAPVGLPLAFASVQLILQNQTNAAISFSFNGSTSAITLAAGSIFFSDVQANRDGQNPFRVPQGTQFYVSGAPTSGAVYISSFYANSRNEL